MLPDSINFHFCFDNANLPPENTPVLCIFYANTCSENVETAYHYCSLISNINDSSDRFWVKHNSLEKSRVYPFAWVSMPNKLPDSEFLHTLQSKGKLEFKLNPL